MGTSTTTAAIRMVRKGSLLHGPTIPGHGSRRPRSSGAAACAAAPDAVNPDGNDRTRDVSFGRGDRCRFWPVHEDVLPTDAEALRLGDLALGDEAKLGVGEGMEGQATDPQQPGAQTALDLEAQWALGAGHPALALDPELPVATTQVPRS